MDDDAHFYMSIMLPRGESFSRGKFICWNRGADGNNIVRGDYNPILDTCAYEFEF